MIDFSRLIHTFLIPFPFPHRHIRLQLFLWLHACISVDREGDPCEGYYEMGAAFDVLPVMHAERVLPEQLSIGKLHSASTVVARVGIGGSDGLTGWRSGLDIADNHSILDKAVRVVKYCPE
jgi:hypothetical protein